MMTLTSQQKLGALAWAARKKGVNYGELVATMTPVQEGQIYRRYGEYLEAEREKRRELAQLRAEENKKKPRKMQKRGWHL